ncbi:hypothetical protein AMAG_16434 [Allomyces macrogynus ATCC 38327]|uniref:WH1 domain-containing protein n=1 Tax=Allomyces macrogynus (strain ATCC 38327) TaxID=578462 RepID=A0A0L0TDL7_ALLM3|nr:hypothetical protein AMAG_16434 [Allomyces macrogynus ATCC 38327]|eukprot:KNE72674.1 hypothetical protein AMAG_16434 [Allomyces macrogynus ATCC 38327]
MEAPDIVAARVLGSAVRPLAAANARVYTSSGKPGGPSAAWSLAHQGVAALVESSMNPGTNLAFQVIDPLKSRVVWEQRLYRGFDYVQDWPTFHSFEGDSDVSAFSFADTAEAARFASAVKRLAIPPPSTAPAAPPPRPAPAGPPAAPRPPVPKAAPPPPPPAPPVHRAPAVPTVAGAKRTSLTSTVAPVTVNGQLAAGTVPTLATAVVPSADPTTPARRISGSGMFGKKGKKKLHKAGDRASTEALKASISGPYDFRHESGMKVGADGRFVASGIKPEWRDALRRAGISDDMLRDDKTRTTVLQALQDAEASLDAAETAGSPVSTAPAAPPAPRGPPPRPTGPPPPPLGQKAPPSLPAPRAPSSTLAALGPGAGTTRPLPLPPSRSARAAPPPPVLSTRWWARAAPTAAVVRQEFTVLIFRYCGGRFFSM